MVVGGGQGAGCRTYGSFVFVADFVMAFYLYHCWIKETKGLRNPLFLTASIASKPLAVALQTQVAPTPWVLRVIPILSRTNVSTITHWFLINTRTRPHVVVDTTKQERKWEKNTTATKPAKSMQWWGMKCRLKHETNLRGAWPTAVRAAPEISRFSLPTPDKRIYPLMKIKVCSVKARALETVLTKSIIAFAVRS